MRSVFDEFAFVPGAMYLFKFKLKIPFCGLRGFLDGKSTV